MTYMDMLGTLKKYKTQLAIAIVLLLIGGGIYYKFFSIYKYSRPVSDLLVLNYDRFKLNNSQESLHRIMSEAFNMQGVYQVKFDKEKQEIIVYYDGIKISNTDIEKKLLNLDSAINLIKKSKLRIIDYKVQLN